jgi:hypothetical protein
LGIRLVVGKQQFGGSIGGEPEPAELRVARFDDRRRSFIA